MERKFGFNCTTLLHNNVSSFFDYRLDKSMTVGEFVARFHTRRDEIHKLELNDEPKGHLLLRQINLGTYDINIIVGSPGGDCSL